ncbi:hypothetical protein IGI04_036418 [Brassica rapa subsp. trilocularis]|uniref:Uncharacterized protein n=1 Tax=Brassica rapa subsp. trilocularis TaxID=1813537 RepID=A0ABQ7LED1_BRACM|nr:hypothetical protein IGI04_036418 [Brassica rapa subsp. trilocularis]
MTIHDNSQLRDSHSQISTEPTRNVRSDHRSVRPMPRTLSLDRPWPWRSRRSKENGCICQENRPQGRTDHPQARGRSLQSTPLTLGVLSPGGKSFSFSLYFCLVSIFTACPSHAQNTPASQHHHTRFSSLTAGLSLSFFLDPLFIEKASPNCPGEIDQAVKEKGHKTAPFHLFRSNRPPALPFLWAVRKSGP